MVKIKTFDGDVSGLLIGLESIFTELGYNDLTVDHGNRYIIFPSDGTKTLKLAYGNYLYNGPDIYLTQDGSTSRKGTFVSGSGSGAVILNKIYYTSHGIMMTYESDVTVRHSIIIGKLEGENGNKPYGIIGCNSSTAATYPLAAVGAYDTVNQTLFPTYKICASGVDRIHPTEVTGLLPVIVQENGKFFDSIYFNIYTPSPNVVQPYQYEMNGHTYLTDGCYSILDE